VRDPHQAALFADGRDRLLGRQERRDGRRQEQADEVALVGLDLLADQDRQSRRSGFARLEGALDPVVVGDGEVGQPAGGRDPRDIGRPGERIEARGGVAVEVDERACQTGYLTPTGRGTS
jgi:hypothetical protein